MFIVRYYVLILVCIFFQKMASFNPLAMILSQKPMDGNNYSEWKTNLYIVLDFEKLKFVLTTPKPNEPAANDWGKCEGSLSENDVTSQSS